ncbi:MAG: sulfatase-like hydrolase/transferase [Sneathiella sp.]|nr:sulfatase-like hydrolase/transferase [Sneathiella sp.]
MGSKKFTGILAYLLPSMVGIYAVLNFLETNITDAGLYDAIPLLCIAAISGVLIMLLFRTTGLGSFKAALLSSLVVILVAYGSLYFHVVSVLTHRIISFGVFLFILVPLLSLLFVGLARAKATFEVLVLLIAVMISVGAGLAATNIAAYEMNRAAIENADGMLDADLSDRLKLAGKKRNIFYIILDRYADQRTLATDYDFDNSEFTSFLRQNGFFVATESAANYPFTAQSLSSSLNMKYHNFTADQVPSHKDDWMPFIRVLQKNRVTESLQKIGYKYVHMGSWWGPTEKNPMADENFRTTFIGQFNRKFLLRSIFAPLFFASNDEVSRQSIAPDQCLRVPQKLKRLQELAASKEPTFTFAHFLVPHPPFVFDKDGNCLGPKESFSRTLEESYLGQLQYADKFMSALVKTLLSQPGPKPIIIIQADEGPYPTRYRQDRKGFLWAAATDREMRQKLRILNAYYFPDVNTEIFYDQITPVNSFRLLFNAYFGTNLTRLPDRNYAIPDDSNRYDFFEVTDIVR